MEAGRDGDSETIHLGKGWWREGGASTVCTRLQGRLLEADGRASVDISHRQIDLKIQYFWNILTCQVFYPSIKVLRGQSWRMHEHLRTVVVLMSCPPLRCFSWGLVLENAGIQFPFFVCFCWEFQREGDAHCLRPSPSSKGSCLKMSLSLFLPCQVSILFHENMGEEINLSYRTIPKILFRYCSYQCWEFKSPASPSVWTALVPRFQETEHGEEGPRCGGEAWQALS